MLEPNSTSRRCASATLTVLLIALSVAARQSPATGAPQPPGKHVDAGGHLLHVNCSGKGSTTVVLEAGAGDFSFDWALVQAAASRYARVCSYDRAGYAWSGEGPAPRTMRQIAFELHTALANSEIKGPLILVGHSLGGLIARTYARLYPGEVVGMVLVDSSHEDTLISLTDMKTREEKIVRFRELSRGREIPAVKATGNGESREAGQVGHSASSQSKIEAPFDKLPSGLQQLRLWAMSQPSYNHARSGEFDFLPEEMAEMRSDRSKTKHPLGDMPLIVLSRQASEGADAAANKQLNESHKSLQADLVRLSTNSRQIIASRSGHHIQLDEPGLVSDAIRKVISAFRSHKRLDER